MEALRYCSMVTTRLPTAPNEKPMVHLPFSSAPTSIFRPIHHCTAARSRVFTAVSSTVSTEPNNPVEPEVESYSHEEKFNWLDQWYPVMPVCDLDKRMPQAKKVIGLDVVVWWDRNENAWKVFDDMCPHRLAPLSEGRIDQWGRLQCVYHGWCFNGSGDCKFIPQAPPDGPPFHSFKKACVSVYPSTVQNGIVWFWPNTNPQYKDILTKKQPPYIPELDDLSCTRLMLNRDVPYGYEFLIENLMDPAHVPYAHYGLMRIPNLTKRVKADREGGRPLEMTLEKLDHSGFIGNQGGDTNIFIAPCVFHVSAHFPMDRTNGSVSSAESKKEAQQRLLLIFFCIPVSPGNSRLIWTIPRSFGAWVHRVVPRWIFHLGQNRIIDSDLYLLHASERKIKDIGPSNWLKACFVPTKSDACVVAFRKWLNKYAGGQVYWPTKFSEALPPAPPREHLMDRYWSHVVNCSSCRVAIKGLKALEVALQVVSVAAIGILAATKQSLMSVAGRTVMVSMAVICFAASRWWSYFIYKNFHFHDYNHAVI